MMVKLDDDVEADIAKEEELLKAKEPLEKAKQRLRDKQETIHEVPDHPYVTIKIPDKGKIGKECVVKISEKVPKLQLVISQDIQWKKRDKYDRTAKPEMVCKGFIIVETKNSDTIKAVWEDVGIVAQKPTNLLQEGDYLVECRAWNNEAWEETTARRLVKVTK